MRVLDKDLKYQVEEEEYLSLIALENRYQDSWGCIVGSAGFLGDVVFEADGKPIISIERIAYYPFLQAILVYLKYFLVYDGENKLVRNFLMVLEYDRYYGRFRLINNLETDGYIYIYGYAPEFDKDEYPFKYYGISYNEHNPLEKEYFIEDLSLYLGHQRSLTRLLDKNNEYQKEYGKPIYLKYTPRELIKEVIDCYDENISEIVVNSFAYRSSFFQNLRKQIEFYRELIKGLNDDWGKDREYLRNYDFSLDFTDKAILVSDDELEELKNKYARANPDIAYYNYEFVKDGVVQEDIHWHYELEEGSKYIVRIKSSKVAEYIFCRALFRKEFQGAEDLIQIKTELFVNRPATFLNEYDIEITVDNHYIAEFEYPWESIIPTELIGEAAMQLWLFDYIAEFRLTGFMNDLILRCLSKDNLNA